MQVIEVSKFFTYSMTAAEESSGLPHRFSLDDIDEQSRVLSSTQKSFQQSVPKVVAVRGSSSQWFSNVVSISYMTVVVFNFYG